MTRGKRDAIYQGQAYFTWRSRVVGIAKVLVSSERQDGDISGKHVLWSDSGKVRFKPTRFGSLIHTLFQDGRLLPDALEEDISIRRPHMER